MAYDFAGALKSGVSPQQITNYLSSQGRGQEAQTYFNLNPAPHGNSFGNALTSLKNFAVNTGKDALGTLLVKPATRVAEAGTGVVTNTLENQNENNRANLQTQIDDLINKSKTATGTQKTNLLHQALTLQRQAEPLQQQGSNLLNIDNRINENQSSLGIDVEPQKGGVAGVEQIAGDAAKSASFLALPEAGEELGEAPNAVSKIISGAKGGAEIGALAGAGNEVQKPGTTAEKVLEGAGKGAAVGTLVGGGIPAIAEGTKAASEGINDVADTVENKIKNVTKSKASITPEQISQEAIKNPADMEQAFKDGRITLEKGKNIIQPSRGEQGIINTLKPLAETGNEAGILQDAAATGNKGVEAQLNNRAVVQQELENESTKLRGALQGWDETDKLNAQKTKDFLENASPIEKARFVKSIGGPENLKSELSPSSWNLKDFREQIGPDNVKIPDPVKNEPTMARNAASLQNAAGDLAKKVGRNSEDLLDLRQNFDDYVQQNYGKNFFDKGRNADPFHQYVYSMRDKINELAADRLPEGQLPDGSTYKQSMLKQHNLINARDEMAAKYAREVPENSTTVSRWMKANPTKSMLIRRIGMREGIGIGASAIGLTALGAEIHKSLSGK